MLSYCSFFFFFFNDTATTEIYTLSLHDALPIYGGPAGVAATSRQRVVDPDSGDRHDAGIPHHLGVGNHVARSEEHTSELQSQSNIVCRLLLEKKKKKKLTLRSMHV